MRQKSSLFYDLVTFARVTAVLLARRRYFWLAASRRI